MLVPNHAGKTLGGRSIQRKSGASNYSGKLEGREIDGATNVFTRIENEDIPDTEPSVLTCRITKCTRP